MAPRPVRGVDGASPHTAGPATMAGATTASAVKNERSTAATLIRLHRSSVVRPRARRRPTSASTLAVVGGRLASSSTSSTTGRAART